MASLLGTGVEQGRQPLLGEWEHLAEPISARSNVSSICDLGWWELAFLLLHEQDPPLEPGLTAAIQHGNILLSWLGHGRNYCCCLGVTAVS